MDRPVNRPISMIRRSSSSVCGFLDCHTNSACDLARCMAIARDYMCSRDTTDGIFHVPSSTLGSRSASTRVRLSRRICKFDLQRPSWRWLAKVCLHSVGEKSPKRRTSVVRRLSRQREEQFRARGLLRPCLLSLTRSRTKIPSKQRSRN